MTYTDSPYFASVIANSDSPTLMAAIYQAATDTDLPRCKWWARRHKWHQNAMRGLVHIPGDVTGRSFVCGRCGVVFSVGSLGWETWKVTS